MSLCAIQWNGDSLGLLDQRELPRREVWISAKSAEEVAEAIRLMVVRGAPAIGIAAAYGMVLALKAGEDPAQAAKRLIAARPTAVNLAWAVNRLMAVEPRTIERLLQEAQELEAEDLAMNRVIGAYGAELVPDGARIMTICNTGALATGGHGTALGIIRSAHEMGKNISVWACETRPRLQGLRLTAFELLHERIPFHVIADGVAASLMSSGKVDVVVAGADRIATNGDTANKIGTYSLAVLAKHHKVPFIFAAPSSTIDSCTASGEDIPIEERTAEEVTHIEGVPLAPEGTPVFNPAFDVTPASLIDAIVTEKGVFRPPYYFTIQEVLGTRV